MCKYCKLKETKIPGELTNDYRTIGYVKDGVTYFSLIMNRCKCNSRVNELVLEQSICIDGTDYVVKTKEIPIKYCPFCGEELKQALFFFFSFALKTRSFMKPIIHIKEE